MADQNIQDLAQKIADDLFTPGGSARKQKAKHLRLYTEAGDSGKYLAGWSQGPMASRIAEMLIEAGVTLPDNNEVKQ